MIPALNKLSFYLTSIGLLFMCTFITFQYRCLEMFGVTYRRVSTNNQTYGTGVQEQQISQFCISNDIQVVKDFVEIESGKNKDRKQLSEAIALCKSIGACLVVYKIDRLTRDIGHLQEIRNSGIDLQVVSLGINSSELIQNLMGTIAQWERETISTRTRQALAEAKRRGVKLGNPLIEEARKQAVKANMKRGKATAERYIDIIRMLRSDGLSYEATASKLNDMGIRTVRGNLFYGNTVARLAKRLQSQ